jgi:hypothetical protein
MMGQERSSTTTTHATSSLIRTRGRLAPSGTGPHERGRGAGMTLMAAPVTLQGICAVHAAIAAFF